MFNDSNPGSAETYVLLLKWHC